MTVRLPPSMRLVCATALTVGVCALLTVASASASTPKPTTYTTTARPTVAARGNYVVTVTVPPPPSSVTTSTVTVTLGKQVQSNVPIYPAVGVSMVFYAHLSKGRFTVRGVFSGWRAHLLVRVGPAPATATGATGSTGSTGSTGATGPLSLIGPPRGPYNNLVWSDEFSGPANTAPNPSNWSTDNGGGCGANTLSTNTHDLANASLNGNGQLAITAIPDGSGRYTTAQLDTSGLMSFEYGRIEARFYQPVGTGLCSAFWLLGDGATPLSPPCWPQCGEIDILEQLGNNPFLADAFVHGPMPNTPSYQQWGSAVHSLAPLAAGYHTFGLIWNATSLTWTLDGVPWVTITKASLATGSTWAYSGHTFHLILDLAVGGWPGPPTPNTKFPATLLFDWVRIYQ